MKYFKDLISRAWNWTGVPYLTLVLAIINLILIYRNEMILDKLEFNLQSPVYLNSVNSLERLEYHKQENLADTTFPLGSKYLILESGYLERCPPLVSHETITKVSHYKSVSKRDTVYITGKIEVNVIVDVKENKKLEFFPYEEWWQGIPQWKPLPSIILDTLSDSLKSFLLIPDSLNYVDRDTLEMRYGTSIVTDSAYLKLLDSLILKIMTDHEKKGRGK